MDQHPSDEVRNLIDELKTGVTEFKKQQTTLVETYTRVITALNQTQEGYGETLKLFIQRLQKDSKPIQDVNASLEDLLNTAVLFGGKVTQTSKQIDGLSQLATGIENNISAWSAETKNEIKSIHQQAGKSLFRKVKIFVLANTVCVVGVFAMILYFFYKAGLFNF